MSIGRKLALKFNSTHFYSTLKLANSTYFSFNFSEHILRRQQHTYETRKCVSGQRLLVRIMEVKVVKLILILDLTNSKYSIIRMQVTCELTWFA